MLGDSIVKHVQSWGITNRIDNKQKVYVRQFLGSKVDGTKDYMKPIRDNDPNHLISRRVIVQKKITIDQLTYYLIRQKFLKDVFYNQIA